MQRSWDTELKEEKKEIEEEERKITSFTLAFIGTTDAKSRFSNIAGVLDKIKHSNGEEPNKKSPAILLASLPDSMRNVQ